MIFAESFECLIPSDSAIKSDVLYCAARPNNGWEITGFFVDSLVALGTLGSLAIAVWVALDARKRVAEERARIVILEKNARLRDAGDRVVSAFATFVENVETVDYVLYQAISGSIQNLAIAYDFETGERDELCTALSFADLNIFQPIHNGRMEIITLVRDPVKWETGIHLWTKVLTRAAHSIRHLFDALKVSSDSEMRSSLIHNFQHEMEFASRSLKASMSNFLEEGTR